MYWGDFHGDPPDCCDPCNCMGDYTGCGDTYGGCGCGNCGGAPVANHGVPTGKSYSTPEQIDPSPSAQPTKAPTLAPPKKEPYYSGQRQRRTRSHY